PNVELTSLVGDAVFTPLVTVLRGLHDLRLDARLQVEKTWVDLRGGEVFASAARSVRGAKVIDRLVRRRAGTFSVVLGPPPTTDRFLDVRFDDLIIRALEDAQTELPDRHVFVRVDTGVALQSGELTTGQRALLEVIDDCHTVGDLLDALPGPDGKVAEALAKLVERGAVTLHRPRSHTAVVTDSSADLPMSLIREHDIKVVPLSVKFGDSTFRDGVDILARDFYQLLETEPTDPETEPPTAAEILAAYQQVVEFQDIVSVHISSKLSQTFVQAQHAALEGARTFELPVSRHNVALEVIDGNNVSVGTGLLVLAAARMALRGEKVFTIAQRLRQLAPRIELLFVVDTLDYLVRGGRVGKARALVGKLLNIKPILGAVNGEIDSIDKVRGGRKAHPRIVELMAQRIDPKQPIVACVAHAKAPVWADRLAKLIQERFDVHELIMSDIGPGVGTHAGPGTVGVAFYQPSDEEWALVGPLSGDAAGAP
ncbi:MAG: DegV family protein, partial [Acidobacteriota bacterium]